MTTLFYQLILIIFEFCKKLEGVGTNPAKKNACIFITISEYSDDRKLGLVLSRRKFMAEAFNWSSRSLNKYENSLPRIYNGSWISILALKKKIALTL